MTSAITYYIVIIYKNREASERMLEFLNMLEYILNMLELFGDNKD